MSKVNHNLKQRLTQALDSFFELGFALTPLLGNKAPYRNNWQHEAALSKEALIREINSGRSKGLGIRTGAVSGGIVAVDLDGSSATAKLGELSGSLELPRTVAFTSGRVGRCQYIYTVPEQFWFGCQTKKFKTGATGDDGKPEQVELRWDGCQSVLPPSVHPTTGQYKWVEGCAPSECEIAQAPLWLIELMLVEPTVAQPQQPKTAATRFSHHKNEQHWTNIDWALSYLQALASSRADDYDEWLAVGMALHSVDDSLLSEWDAWSQQSSKYKSGVCDRKWHSFKRTGVSIGSLAHMAKSDGWTKPCEKGDRTSVKQHHPIQTKISSVTSDTSKPGDASNSELVNFLATVTSVTAILARGLSSWEEHAHLDELQSKSGISKGAFWELVASLRCQSDEVTSTDEQQLNRLIDWKNAEFDFKKVIPHMAEDLLHDGQVLNIDPIMLWQYLLPATLSLVGKKNDLVVGSHAIPAIAWTCLVAKSGMGKSRAEGVILAPLKAWQKAEYDRFKPEWAKYKKSQNQNKKSDNSSPQEPPLPERKFLFVIATIQAVIKRLSEQGKNGSLWARDEIAGLFKSLGQFSAKGEGEGLECLLPCWDGASSPVDRVQHDDSYHVDSSRLSIAGGLQPGVFRKIFSDPDDAQGIQARFLFALPKELPAKRVKGYCHLSDKLPAFYRWVDTQFPAGNIKLSKDADALYDVVYESMGRQATAASTTAVGAWMRKLPGQLLRIALALHVIECYHEPGRPRHELQLDTLNRAVDLCRYYRSTFEVVQESASDSDRVSSILLKIWDMAATSPSGLVVRDAYRSIKALSRRAKELGRNVAAYTIDLYYELEKMGRGSVQKAGRLVRFVAGIPNPPSAPPTGHNPKNPPGSPSDTEGATVVTDDVTVVTQGLELSPQELLSLVTQQNLEQVDTNWIQPDDVQNSAVGRDTLDSMENIIGSKCISDESPDAPGEEVLKEVKLVSSAHITHSIVARTKPLDDDETQLLNQTDIQQWLERIASVESATDCIRCIDALNCLPQQEIEQIWSAVAQLLPRFWEIAEIEVTQEPHQNPGVGFGTKVSAQQQTEQPCEGDRIIITPGAEIDHKSGIGFAPQASLLKGQQPSSSHDRITQTPREAQPEHSAQGVKKLITGLWVRCRDGRDWFYGYLGAMTGDGRWWVSSPKTRTHDAESRLFAAVDIVPMPAGSR